MNGNEKLLSDLVVYTKYARYRPDLKRRETWEEIIDRYLAMMLKKYCGEDVERQFKAKKVNVEKGSLAERIITNGQYLYEKKVLPSMRACQFSGPAIEKNNMRMFNCAAEAIDHYKAFSEIMFALLGGTGMGYSVMQHHIDKLPSIVKPQKSQKYVIDDSIEGWASAVNMLVKAYFGKTKTKPRFDYSSIRPKGEQLITAGGKAPGPAPLRICLTKIECMLEDKEEGSKLSSLECHDICCHIADAVLAGGIRRAALISLFSFGDMEMATCKSGAWWEKNPQRGRANNSVMMHRDKVTEEEFKEFFKTVRESGSGEPGFYWTNDDNAEYLTNPCFSYDTEILTADGYKPIGALDGQELDLINESGDIVLGRVWKSGTKPVSKIKLTTGKIIEVTKDHVFKMADESEKATKDIKRWDRIMPFYHINKNVNKFTEYGFIQGDGSTGRLKSKEHLGLEINLGYKDNDVADLFDIEREEGKTSYYVRGYNEVLTELGFNSSVLPERGLPSSINDWTDYNLAMFLKGLWSANGSIIKGHRISFKSTCLHLVEQLKGILENRFDIKCYYTTNKPKKINFKNGEYLCKESYDLNITRIESIITFASKIGFVHKYKNESLENLIKEKAPSVLSVKEGEEKVDVYDFELFDDTHWGVIEGVIAHNCAEISLKNGGLCNLTEVNSGNVESQEDFNNRARVGSFFGTLQAGFTDFHLLRGKWKRAADSDALVGVGLTGICNGRLDDLDLTQAARIANEENARVAEEIGINKAARVTTVKPSGSTSSVLGVSSGIHSWYSPYYIRNMQCRVGDDLYNFFTENHPELIKIMDLDPQSAVIGCPMKAPEGALLREDETAIDFLERVKKYNVEYVREGHRSGPNTNNVSATCSVRNDKEWDAVRDWMWDNREYYNGISLLPYDGGTYKDAPFQECDEETYLERLSYTKGIDLTKINEDEDNTDLQSELACVGGACDLTY